MEFYTPNGLKRPVRLSKETRQFAHRSLHCQYGLDTLKTDSVSLDHLENIEKMSALDRYDAATKEIAKNAPLRLVPKERISGAATLGAAIRHVVPQSGNASDKAGTAFLPKEMYRLPRV